jgi:hypothetical protein
LINTTIRGVAVNDISRIVDFDDSTFDPFIADETAFGDVEDLYGPLAKLRGEARVP